jgi:hypothetical protein
MRPLTSAVTMIRIPTVTTPPFTLDFIFLLLEPANVLVKCATASLFRSHSLELLTLSEARLDLFVSISDQDRGL